MGMSVVTIFEILHHVAMLFVRTGAKSLGVVRRTMIIPNKSRTEIDGLGKGSEIKSKKSLEEHLDSVNNQRRQQSSTNQGFIKQSVFLFDILHGLVGSIYCTRAIITRSLYFFNLLFEGAMHLVLQFMSIVIKRWSEAESFTIFENHVYSH